MISVIDPEDSGSRAKAMKNKKKCPIRKTLPSDYGRPWGRIGNL